MICIVRYVKGSPGHGLLYEDYGSTQIVGYSYVGWARSPSNRQSTLVYLVLFGDNLISWKTRKQDVERSNAEIEY